MSFTGSRYDVGGYKAVVRESMGPGLYQIERPMPGRDPCGPGTVADHESELLGLTRKASSDPRLHFQPGTPEPPPGSCDMPHISREEVERLQAEGTRISNPSCNLRGTGVNRFGHLPRDPRQGAISPVYIPSSDRQMARDNHRPLLPKPIDPTPSMPPPAPDCVKQPRYEFPPVPLVPELLPRRPFGAPPPELTRGTKTPGP